VLWALTALRFGLSWELPAFLLLAAVGVLLAVVDLRTRLLPDRLVLPALAAGTVLLTVAAVAGHDLPALGRAAAGAAVGFAGYLVLALVAPAGLGMGDVKLAALLGLHLAWLGWPVLVDGALAGFVVQAVLAAVLLATRRVALRGYIPFGPAMLAGAALGIALIR
jgi:leader peptidase (prepilin peptidase) / N-methyltransferase